jgi:hypothetical protein
MFVRDGELCANTKLGAYALRKLKHSITIEFDGGGKHNRGSMVFGVSVFYLQEDGLKGSACFVYENAPTYNV